MGVTGSNCGIVSLWARNILELDKGGVAQHNVVSATEVFAKMVYFIVCEFQPSKNTQVKKKII